MVDGTRVMKPRADGWLRTFLIIFIGQAFSLLGSSAVNFALVWWLLRRRAKTARRGRHSDSGSVTPSAGDIRPEQSPTKEAVSSHIPSAS